MKGPSLLCTQYLSMTSSGKSVEKQINELTTQLDNLNLYAFKNIVAVASDLGVKRTRLELLPMLANVSVDPKMLSGIAEQLGNLREQVGGPAYHNFLVAPLEVLAAASESAVRSKAVQSLRTLLVLHSDSELNEHYIPLLRRLSVHSMSPGRASVCGLLSVAYPRASTTIRDELRTLFSQLCQDQELSVRQAAAKSLGDLGKVLESDHLKSYIIPLLIHFHHNEEDWARLCTAEASASIAPLLSQEDRERFILPIFRQWAKDKNCQVRCILADNFMNLKKALGFAVTMQDWVSAFKSLLEDSNSDVRGAAVKKLLKFCQSVDPSEKATIIIKTIVPCVKKLVVDASEGVRSALATVIVGLCPILGKEKTVEHLLLIFLTLMKDECDKVKFNITSNLDSVNEVVGTKQFSYLMLFGIEELARAKNWRVRQNLINSMPLCFSIARQLHQVWKIGSESRPFLGGQSCYSSIVKLTKDKNYKFRLTALFCINVLADVCEQHTLRQMLPIVARLADDRIANVRFNVAKTLQKIGSVVICRLY
ncbi:Serine/threonine-protein phosphatase 2A 65 kDa regulatory subunit A alpha isoform [Orchesella cincta]|uniref:Serine/threonine-protein phosphatase 2A 65 kDa regulatory subunit A alpha isoform n=1 Tax=Orchesella cincta TaxID=48709 RepID=A0A1D2M765_ORCCI|nr:Serine/threonine-protein phosphatase 2A 65 kDa regulatory subunit A alpha isoform [Orchesella cincta]